MRKQRVNEPPAWLRRLDPGIISPRRYLSASSGSGNTGNTTDASTGVRNASSASSTSPPACLDYLYKSYPILPISYTPSPANDIDPKREQIRNRVKEASAKLGIPQPKPAWLKSHNFFLTGRP